MIILMGVAGSGKSVQGKRLSEALHCPWIGIGNLLRLRLNEDRRAELLSGKLLDDHEVLEILAGELATFDSARQQCILDGSPRTLAQAEWLDNYVRSGHLSLSAIIHLQAPKDLVRSRLLRRGRPDDHEAAITERFLEYDEHIVPILNFFADKGYVVHTIDADGTEDEVAARINQALSNAT